MHQYSKLMSILVVLFLGFVAFVIPQITQAEIQKLKGQRLLLPVHSEIVFGDKKNTLPLTITVTIRNSDDRNEIKLSKMTYHNSDGLLLVEHVKKEAPLSLKPFSSQNFFVKQSDLSGGLSPCFIVEWESGAPVAPPIVEAVMISTVLGQGISFSSNARILQEYK